MIRMAPISVFDVPAQQARPEDMAAKGWFLKDYSSGVFSLVSFAKGEPHAAPLPPDPPGRGTGSPSAALPVFPGTGGGHDGPTLPC